MHRAIIYIVISLLVSACQFGVKGPDSVTLVPDTFKFSQYNTDPLINDIDERLSGYTLVKTDADFALGPGGNDYNQYDVIPLVENDRFKFYLNLYTGNYKEVFQRWLDRSNEYIYIVRDILRREGVPEELAYLPFTESGYNPSIRSRAGACGMWQFMKYTGKMYDLDSNFWVEERRDFEKATVAAARHLRDLYDKLGDWYLAMAAYNAGIGKIYNAIKRYKTRDFFVMSQRKYRYLKLETKDYVPKYLALRYLARNYQEFGFDTPDGQPQLFERITLKRQANLYMIASLIESDIDTIRELNPELMTPMTPPVEEYSLRIPYGTRETLEEALRGVSDEELAQFHIQYAKSGQSVASYARKYGMSTAELKDVNGLTHNTILRDTYLFIPIDDVYDSQLNEDFVKELKRYNPKVHFVRRGENLYMIAHKYGMSLYQLLSLNQGINPKLIRPGQTVVVSDSYYNSRSKRKAVRTYTKKHFKSGNYVTAKHRVKSGESLWSIANKYGTTVSQIKSSNGLSDNIIQPGHSLTVYDYRQKSIDKAVNGKYTVRSGDSLWVIAKKFGISVSSLKQKNSLKGNEIFPGSILVVD